MSRGVSQTARKLPRPRLEIKRLAGRACRKMEVGSCGDFAAHQIDGGPLRQDI